eukprot:Lankesteria_metandrocarpae@DN5467_c1_g1_i20.p1
MAEAAVIKLKEVAQERQDLRNTLLQIQQDTETAFQSWTDEKTSLVKKFKESKQHLAREEGQRKIVQTTMDNIAAELTAIKTQLLVSEEECDTKDTEISELEAALQKEKDSRGKLSDVEMERDRLRLEFDSARERFVNLDRIKESNESEIQQIKGENEALQSHIQAKESEIQQMSGENEAFRSRLQAKESEIQHMKGKNDALQSHIQTKESENQQVKGQNEALQSHIQAKESENQQVKGQNEALQSHIQAKESEIQQVKGENEALQSRIQAKESEIQQVKGENKALQSHIQAKESEIQQVKGENKALQNHMQTKETELESYVEKFEQVRGGTETLQNNLQAKESEIQQLRGESTTLQNHIQSQESETERLRGENKELQVKLQCFERLLTESQTQETFLRESLTQTTADLSTNKTYIAEQEQLLRNTNQQKEALAVDLANREDVTKVVEALHAQIQSIEANNDAQMQSKALEVGDLSTQLQKALQEKEYFMTVVSKVGDDGQLAIEDLRTKMSSQLLERDSELNKLRSHSSSDLQMKDAEMTKSNLIIADLTREIELLSIDRNQHYKAVLKAHNEIKILAEETNLAIRKRDEKLANIEQILETNELAHDSTLSALRTEAEQVVQARDSEILELKEALGKLKSDLQAAAAFKDQTAAEVRQQCEIDLQKAKEAFLVQLNSVSSQTKEAQTYLDVELQKVRKELDEKDLYMTQIHEKMSNQCGELKELQNVVTEKEEAVQKYRSTLENATETLQARENELSALKSTLTLIEANAAEEIGDIKRTTAQATREFHRDSMSYQDTNAELQSMINRLEQELDNLNTKLERQTECQKDLEVTLTEKERRCQSLTRLVEPTAQGSASDFDRLEQTVEQLSKELEQRTAEETTLRQKVYELEHLREESHADKATIAAISEHLSDMTNLMQRSRRNNHDRNGSCY